MSNDPPEILTGHVYIRPVGSELPEDWVEIGTLATEGVFERTPEDDDSASGPPFSAVIDRIDYDLAWEPNEGADE